MLSTPWSRQDLNYRCCPTCLRSADSNVDKRYPPGQLGVIFTLCRESEKSYRLSAPAAPYRKMGEIAVDGAQSRSRVHSILIWSVFLCRLLPLWPMLGAGFCQSLPVPPTTL